MCTRRSQCSAPYPKLVEAYTRKSIVRNIGRHFLVGFFQIVFSGVISWYLRVRTIDIGPPRSSTIHGVLQEGFAKIHDQRRLHEWT